MESQDLFSNEDIEYVNSTKKDLEWLGFNWDGEVKFSSNYFDLFYQLKM